MIDVHGWLSRFPGARWTPLFATNDALEVQTHLRGRDLNRRLLTRALGFDSTVTEMIETGLHDPSWPGLLYLMGTRDAQDFRPLYIGKTERRGVRHEVSRNIANIRHNTNKFARWGYGLDYHVGDLSHALFDFAAYRAPTPKYRRWAEVLFATFNPPTLKVPVTVLCLPWHETSRGPSGLIGSRRSGKRGDCPRRSALWGLSAQRRWEVKWESETEAEFARELRGSPPSCMAFTVGVGDSSARQSPCVC